MKREERKIKSVACGAIAVMQLAPIIASGKKVPGVMAAIRLMRHMTPAERLDVMDNFCPHCGDDNPRCHCMNDD